MENDSLIKYTPLQNLESIMMTRDHVTKWLRENHLHSGLVRISEKSLLHDKFFIVRIGSDRPTLKSLYDHVVMKVADKWRDLGVQLLRSDQERLLNIIEVDHPLNATGCCKCLFEKWLETNADATWNVLIKALKSPTVQLDYLASQLEKMLMTECEICLLTMYFVWLQGLLASKLALCMLRTDRTGYKNILLPIISAIFT